MNQLHEKTDLNGISFLFFDLDDTLIDHRTAQERGLIDLWTKFPPLQELDPKELTATFGRVNAGLWERYRDNSINKASLKRKRFENTFKELEVKNVDWREADAVYMDAYSRHWDWIEDARDVFVKLCEKYRCGIMTNGFTAVQKKKFEYFSFQRYCRLLIISEEVGYLKPDRRIFHYSAEMAGYPPEKILYVGDSYSSDIIGGLQSGWKTAWYVPEKDFLDNPAELKKMAEKPDLVFHAFSELLAVLS